MRWALLFAVSLAYALILTGAETTVPFVGNAPIRPVLAAACPTPQSYEYDSADPAPAIDGARAEWKLRALDATDWAGGGHTNTTVWLTTNDASGNQWVEVGVTDGYRGENTYTFYSAHRYWTGTMYKYQDVKIGKAANLGTVVQFKVYWNGSNFRGDVIDPNGSAGIGWSGNALPASAYVIGAEYTCPGTARVDRTYTLTNQYRRVVDGLWVNATNGSLIPSGNANTGILWCTQPVFFRFWVNSQISTTECF